MTVTTDTNRITHAGDGVTTAFPVPFAFFAANELEVIERVIATGAETPKALTTDYTVTGGGGTTGTVTANVAPAATVSWTIVRSTRLTQEIDYSDNDAFPAETHESGLDRATMIAQDAFADVGRSLKFPKTDAADLLKDLPSSVERADKFVAFDAVGNVIATAGPVGDSTVPVSAFIETLIDDPNAAIARTTLGAQVDLRDVLTADGDILYRTGGVVTRLAKGTDSEFLALAAGLPAWSGSLAFPASGLTLSLGSVTPARTYHTIDTEAAAATDDLDTIATGSVPDNAILILTAANAARTVVVKHGTGNIFLEGDEDYLLDDDQKSLVLQRRGANWHELTRSVDIDQGLASVQVFTTSGTWNRPAGIKKIVVEGVGPGGGSESADSSTGGAGGGGGGYCKKFIDVSAISSVTVTIGSVGVGGTQPAGNGTAATATSFGAHWTAGGGGGGSVTGGAGGTATGGDINIPGQKGSDQVTSVTDGAPGGDSMFGFGGQPEPGGNNAVESGSGFGAGGGGAATGNTNGANGSPGIAIVWEYK